MSTMSAAENFSSIQVELMNIAASIARSAGDLIYAGRATDLGTVATKSSATDMVTQWDSASEDFITQRLEKLRPLDAIRGEEGTCIAGSSGITWLIDPIDGTTNFMYGLSGYAVSIAACDALGTISGAVYLPVTRQLFTASRGQGAWLGGQRLHCSTITDIATALIGTGFSYASDRRREQADRLVRVLPAVRDVRRMGAAAADLCYVANGGLDGYYEQFLQPWDLAAGLLIATEAGAISSNFTGGAVSPSQVIVCAPGIGASLRALIAG